MWTGDWGGGRWAGLSVRELDPECVHGISYLI